MSTPGTCLMCGGPAPDAPCCSTACLQAATRERDRNLRQLRLLRARPGTADARERLTRRNGALTGAIVSGLRPLRLHEDEPSSASSIA